MPKKSQPVILKGRANGIDIFLDDKTEFAQLGRSLRDKVINAKAFFGGADTNIAFKGRALSDEEEKKLLDIVLAETSLDVSFVEGNGFVAPLRAPEAPVNTTANIQHKEQNTAYYPQGLRSGQSIRFPGSVVVMGDINPGGEIVAHGNVIVLGSMRGMVHAGAEGDDHCYVSAFAMQPTQLRIAGLITYIPDEKIEARKKNKKALKPEWAFIKDGQICIAPLTD